MELPDIGLITIESLISVLAVVFTSLLLQANIKSSKKHEKVSKEAINILFDIKNNSDDIGNNILKKKDLMIK